MSCTAACMTCWMTAPLGQPIPHLESCARQSQGSSAVDGEL